MISGIVTTVFLSAKACLYNTFDSRNGISPVAVVDGQHRLGLPFLLISSAVFALVHIMVAYKSRCQARRKLAFFLMDAESVSSSSILSLLASCICSQEKFSVNMSSSLLPCFVHDGCRMGHDQFSLLAFCICSEFFFLSLEMHLYTKTAASVCYLQVSVSKISGNSYPRNPRATSSPLLFRKMDLDCSSLVGKHDGDKDVPAHMLADKQSLFMDCKGLVLHYKVIDGGLYRKQEDDDASADGTGFHSAINMNPVFQTAVAWNPSGRASSLHAPLLSNSSPRFAIPSIVTGWPAIGQQTGGQKPSAVLESLEFVSEGDSKLVELYEKDTGVVLLHGFGGGVFSWRHVMGSIAMEVGCRVVAFDRPGWGLTSRPRRSEWETKGLPNPYDLHAQVDLLFAFCQELGLRSVVLMGHSDGGLLALMAAARALKSKDSIQVCCTSPL